ncbi:hypothetical protein FALBO_5354 [Fusarium albosuccineum]|uniref:Tetraspanin n=1 Tax=Fusarium albosuccineum TaxID=1237068 RepID=A0A8H4P9W1_9HYPO|nr:hypothetical protein FALBO_5354 [Fusarium albosuccineum]
MLNPTLLYFVLSLVLIFLAVVVHVHSSSLSLAISPTLSILVILLPIAASLNTLFHPRLRRISLSSSSRTAKLAPLVLQVLQALATTILATLLFEHVLPSGTMECMLDTQWMHMFRAHDATGIRRIQDALDCCGLNSVVDRAYPFPGTSPSTCAQTYGRRTACQGPWRGALQTASGLDLAVVLTVGLMQIFNLLLAKDGSGWWNAWGTFRQGQATEHLESRRPLLTGTVEEETPSEPSNTETRRYGGADDNEFGPRVEPSVVAERNTWAEG